MVYSSDFYTTRSTRPYVSSYSVSYPVHSYSTGKSRVYTASSYPIYTPTYRYSYTLPYISTRVISSPIRTVTTRVYRSPSPVRTITTTRIIRSPSPVRVISTPLTYTRVISSPYRYYSPSYLPISYPSYRSYLYSPYIEREITPPRTFRTTSAVLAREYDRIFNRIRPSYGYSPLAEYLNSEAFINFDSEARRIKSDAHSLLREIHSHVPRRTRSVTPYFTYDDAPNTLTGLQQYVSRITDPSRHIAREVRSMSLIPDSPRKYMGMESLRALDPNRPTRKFGAPKQSIDDNQDLKDKQRERAEKLAAISEETNTLKEQIVIFSRGLYELTPNGPDLLNFTVRVTGPRRKLQRKLPLLLRFDNKIVY